MPHIIVCDKKKYDLYPSTEVKFQHILLREKVNYLIVIKKLAEGFEVNESFLHCFFFLFIYLCTKNLPTVKFNINIITKSF